MISCKNHEGLFASLAQTIDQLGLNIVDAKLVDTRNTNVIDSFLVLDANGKPVTEQAQLMELERRIYAAARNDKFEFQAIEQHIPRQQKHFKLETHVSFADSVSGDYTIMEIIAHDRPGLLSRISLALMECSVIVKMARIATFGEKAEDIFHIVEKTNQPVSEKTKQRVVNSINRLLG